jgi:DNA-binding SARP family transcriptional activator
MDFRILGPLEASDEGRVLALGGTKQRAVLALLLLHPNERLSAERLIDELWGEKAPPAAAKSLQMHVGRLRKALARDGVLETQGSGYRVRLEPGDLDLSRFERLAADGRRSLAGGDPASAARQLSAALAEWRGPALADLATEPFAQLEVARLDELRLAAIEDHIDAELGIGRHAELVAELEPLVAEHPFRERLRAQLMLALYRSGRQAEALRAYRDARHTLVEELGLEPGRRLQQLEAAMLAQDAELDWRAPAVAASATAPLPRRLDDSSAVGFVGREDETRALTEAWAETLEGRRRVVLLAGEPGIGKTRLAGRLARRAHGDGATVLHGQCDEEVQAPYRPWVDALRQYLEDAPQAVLERHVAAHGGELARLAPTLARRLPGLPAPSQTDPEAERYLLFGAVAGLLAEAAADRPLMLVIDDLHWADKPTLLLLRHLVTEGEANRLALVGTYRHTDLSPEHPLTPVLADLRREPGVQRIGLTGLGETEVVELMESGAERPLRSDELGLARDLTRETNGNPFFLTEMLRHLVEAGAIAREDDGWRLTEQIDEVGLPESVREVVGRRVQRLGEPVGRLLRMAAVIGRRFDSELLARVAEVDEDDLLDTLDAAVRARLISESADMPGRFAFSHALVNTTLADELGSTRRARLHRRIAEALEDLSGDDPGARLPALAHHWTAAATRTDRAIELCRLAGQRALEQLAPDEAARWFAQALELQNRPPDPLTTCDLLIGLGEAQRQAGDPTFRQTLLEACAIARDKRDGDRLARAALANSRGFQSASGDVDPDRVGALRAALELLDPEDPRRARLLGLLQLELTFLAELSERRRLSDQALAVAREAGDQEGLAHVLWARHAVLWTPDLLEEHRDNAAELEEVATALEDPVSRFWAACDRILVSMWGADLEAADRGLRTITALAERVGQPILRWIALWYGSWRAHLAGRLDEAEALAFQAAEVGTASGMPDAQAFLAGQLVPLRWDQGRMEELVPLLAGALEANPGLEIFRAWLALAHVECDRPEEAERLLSISAGERFEDVREDIIWTATMSLYAEVAARIGARAPAALLYDALAPYADQLVFNATTTLGSIARYAGQLAAALGRYDDAERHFAHAATTHAELEAPGFLARTNCDWALALLERGGPRDAERAQRMLDDATAAAREIGAAGIERRAAGATAGAR